MEMTITIKMDNDAFSGEDSGNEIARILRELATDFEESTVDTNTHGFTFDINGNRVGTYFVE